MFLQVTSALSLWKLELMYMSGTLSLFSTITATVLQRLPNYYCANAQTQTGTPTYLNTDSCWLMHHFLVG